MSADTISDDYLRLQSELHRNPNYGLASLSFAPIVANVIKELHVRTVADYGAGKQNLLVGLKKAGVNLDAYYPYDPVFPDYGPPKSADLVCCIDVLEHIEDDLFALEQMRDVLQPGGKLALLVPSHQFLFGEFDRAVGHFRRYSKQELVGKLTKVGFTVIETKFFSLLAMLPWFVNGRLLKRDYLPAGQASLANKLVPLLRLEKLIGPPCGLSLIAIAQN